MRIPGSSRRPRGHRSRPGAARRFQIERLEPRMLLSADLKIAEFLARNDDTLDDVDGDSSDWIELHNAGSSPADLDGWHLTDQSDWLTKWSLPAVELAANERLVVFASGKDRTDPLGELHTNFVLGGDGEFLALVEPNGTTIKQQFAPFYPEQREDFSYGLEQVTVDTTLLGPSSPVRYLVPTSAGELPADWNDPAMDDTAWTAGTLPVGFDAVNGPGGGSVLVNHALGASTWQSSTLGVNTSDLGVDGNLGNFTHTNAGVNLPATWQVDFGQATPLDQIVLHNRTSCCASRLRDITVQVLGDDGASVAYESPLLNPENVLGGGVLDVGPASLTIDLIAETGGQVAGRYVRVIREPDPDNSGVGGDPIAGPSEPDVLSLGEVEVWGTVVIPPAFETDLLTAMHGQNGSAFVRAAFDVADPGAVDQLHLDVEYDDGFVAYLNGTEVARRRAPETLAFDSTAEVETSSDPAPDEFAGLALWLRDPANNYDEVSGLWSDSSGGGHDAAPVGTVAATGITYVAPTLATSTAAGLIAQSEFATVRFTGTADDLLESTGLNGAAGLNELTIFTVYRTAGADATIPYTRPAGFGSWAANGASGADHFNQAADPSIRKDNGFVGGHSASHPAGSFLIRTSRMDAGGVDEWFNTAGTTTAVLTNAGAQFTTSNDRFFLGDLRAGNTPLGQAARADIDLAEVVVFNTALSDVEIDQINDWLETHVGLPHGDLAAVSETIDLTEHAGLLQPTGNVLAVQGLNLSAADDDFLLDVQLTATDVVDSQVRYFSQPTPGAPNGQGFIDFVADTAFSLDRGFYESAIDVEITTATPGAAIRYTLDGAAPTDTHGALYSGPIHVDGQTLLRAVAYKDGYWPSNVDTHTYLFLDDVIRQPSSPVGFPTSWGGSATNYEVDPNVVGQDGNDLFGGLYADTIKDDLRAIPTLSIVMDPADLFESGGIYANPTQRGPQWERATSLEYILPDGSTGFQEDAGLRIFGFSSRNPSVTPKHSLRLLFKEVYGESKLAYPLFADASVDRFDDIVLRATNAKSWNDRRTTGDFSWNIQAQYIRDSWARDTKRDMGQATSHATYVHLYLNGLYWGLYNPVERPDASYMEEYFGGAEEDYDVLNTRTGTIEVVDGNAEAWNELMTLVSGDVSTPAAFEQVAQHVNFDDMIDWFNIYFYAGARDWVGTNGNNMRVARLREEGAGWIAFPWDFENTFWEATDNNTNVRADLPTLGKVHAALMSNAEYRLRFGDRVYEHYFHDGALTPEQTDARWMARATEIDRAIVGESARWGDTRVEPPRTRDIEWLAEQNRLRTEYFPQRTDILLGQLQAIGLYPNVVAPDFLVDTLPQYGGPVDAGAQLSVFLPDDTTFVDTTLLAQGAAATALIPTDNTLGLTWTDVAFDDGTWLPGTSGVGYDQGAANDYGPLIGLDVGAQMPDVSASVLARIPFSHDDSVSFDQLLLQMQYDDGFVAYLNGVEVARSDSVANDVPGAAEAASHEAAGAEPFDISAFEHLLIDGVDTNVLAIHGINTAIDSSDMLVLPELLGRVLETSTPSLSIYVTTDGSDPRLPGGAINPAATLYNGELTLDETTLVKARALDGGDWSAVAEGLFVIGTPLAISEIMYHPTDPNGVEQAHGIADGDQFEFIELVNTSPFATVDLTDVQLVDGVVFDFATGAVASLAPGERVLVVKDTDDFLLRYGAEQAGLIAGEFTGGLKNGGEMIQLIDGGGATIQQFTYDDGGAWPGRADGRGSSLEVIDTAGNYDDPDNWRSSSEYGGSPGAIGMGPRSDVVVNEVLSNSDAPGLDDAIELLNTTGGDIDLAGWVLSDNSTNYRKFEFPAGTTIHAGEYLVLTEADFNPAVPEPGQSPFALDGTFGDDVWLLETDDTTGDLVSFVDHADFGAAATDESFGRWPDGIGRLYPMAERTFGAINTGPRIGPVVIGEVMYSPTEPTAGELAAVPAVLASDFEFVELFNPSPEVLDLGGWRLDNAVDFVFPPGTMLRPGDALVVLPFDPINDAARLALWHARYPAGSSDALFGPSMGRLNNAGETLQLERPDTPVGDPPVTPWVLVDEVRYEPTTPWPAADATGAALDRTASNAFGNDASSWAAAATPTPGVSTLTYTSAVVGEHVFYANSVFAATSDDAAIATDKTALLPGQSATSANYTNFADGINGLMVDLAQLPDDGAALTATDFAFRTGNDNTPAGWTPIASPTPVVRLDESVDGGDRIVLTWPDETIRNTWLEVTVRATPATGLAADEVFYFGNAVGETGNDPTNALVTAADLIAIRNHPRGLANRADVTNPHDIDRDAVVNATDALLARNHATGPFDALRLIDL